MTSSRTFINRILALFRSSPGHRICLTDEFQHDIDWFLKFLPLYNGVTCIKKLPFEAQDMLYLDACLTGMVEYGGTEFMPPLSAKLLGLT